MINVEKQYQIEYMNIINTNKQINIKVSRWLITEDGEQAKLKDLDITILADDFEKFYNVELSTLPSNSTIGEVLNYLVQTKIKELDSNFSIDEAIANKFKGE